MSTVYLIETLSYGPLHHSILNKNEKIQALDKTGLADRLIMENIDFEEDARRSARSVQVETFAKRGEG